MRRHVVTFGVGVAGTGKTFDCLRQLKELLQSNPLGRQYLLVPAYMTYKIERELAGLVGGGMLNTYVLSFQRFAQHVLQETGGAITPRITDIGRRLLLKKILLDRSKRDELKYFAKAAKQRGFSETLAEQLKELRTYSIDSDALREATFELDDALADKLAQLRQDGYAGLVVDIADDGARDRVIAVLEADDLVVERDGGLDSLVNPLACDGRYKASSKKLGEAYDKIKNM